MESRVQMFRENRKGATVVFTSFCRMQHRYPTSIFCCFEGDDAKYYFHRIENLTKYAADNIEVLNCQGKTEVIRFYKMIQGKAEYSGVKLLYFVDKDFDPIDTTTLSGVYQTPVYSIENFYTTRESFIRILKCEFNYTTVDNEYGLLLNLFDKRQQEFHNKTAYFNAWLACQRDRSSKGECQRLGLTSFNLNQIIPTITLDTVVSNYDKAKLEELFPESIVLTEEEIQNKINSFDPLSYQGTFRGKFEIDFLYSFLESVHVEFKASPPRLTKKNGVQLNLSKKNMISEFSHYASTSECLTVFLGSNKI